MPARPADAMTAHSPPPRAESRPELSRPSPAARRVTAAADPRAASADLRGRPLRQVRTPAPGRPPRLTVRQVTDACRAVRHCLECGENPGCWAAALMRRSAAWAGADRAAAVFPDGGTLFGWGGWASLGRGELTAGRRACRDGLAAAAAAAVRSLPAAGPACSPALGAAELPEPPRPRRRIGAAGDARCGFALAWRDGRGRTCALLVGPPTGGAAVRIDPADERPRILARVAVRELAAAGRRLAHPGEPNPVGLPKRARQVLDCWLDGRLEKEVAGLLDVTPGTVHKHVNRIYRHFRVRSRGELQARWIRRGWGLRREWRVTDADGCPAPRS